MGCPSHYQIIIKKKKEKQKKNAFSPTQFPALRTRVVHSPKLPSTPWLLGTMLRAYFRYF
jgi:hypothetical protein